MKWIEVNEEPILEMDIMALKTGGTVFNPRKKPLKKLKKVVQEDSKEG
jgi:hypothetical protein